MDRLQAPNTLTEASTGPAGSAGKAVRWLINRLAPPGGQGAAPFRGAKLALACAGIFLLSCGVRALHWQDSYVELAQKGPWMSAHARHYRTEALRILTEGGILIPRQPVDPGDARLILHPPGYSAFMAGIFSVAGESDFAVRLAQIVFDSLAAIMILLIAAELFAAPIGIIAGALGGLSPHFGYYSLWTSPDTLSVLPVLVAVYLTIKTIRRPGLLSVIGAGAMIGLSCWLRANALLLAPFLAFALLVLLDRGKRLGYAAVLAGATVLVISPITIRNWILYHQFIPLSIAGGENLVVGIADFDKDGRFGMPNSDDDAAAKDAVWHNRPDYAASPWFPDGVARDQARYARGLEVIRSNPGWFLGVMFRRAFFMLTYNDSSTADWPFNTSRVPIVSATPPPFHAPASAKDRDAVWSSPAAVLFAEGSLLSQNAEASLDGAQRLRIVGDSLEFGDQFASAPISVQPSNDYLLRIELALDQGPAAVKIMSSNRGVALQSAIILGNERRRRFKKLTDESDQLTRVGAEDRMAVIEMVFASGDRNDVRLVISNNGADAAVMRLDNVQLFDLGATPHLWTTYPRTLINGLQRTMFNTVVMLPLVAVGVLLLSVARRGRALVVLLAVPVYYLLVQSALSTEYRYILAMHYFLFTAAAAVLYCAFTLVFMSIRSGASIIRPPVPQSPRGSA